MTENSPTKQPELLEFNDVAGEHLYTKIQDLYHLPDTELQKITGMLLTCDKDDIFSMLQNVELLKTRVDIAKKTLGDRENHKNIDGNDNSIHTIDADGDNEESIAEKLYEAVEQISTDYATQVTGMLLELDPDIVLKLLENPTEMESAVNRAILTITNKNNEDILTGEDTDEDVGDKIFDFVAGIYPDCSAKITGFSANKATGVFMDHDTRLIVGLDVADSREVDRVSQRLERLIVNCRLLHLTTKSNLLVWEVVSDASRSIMALLKTDPFKHLTHSLDIWHKSKKLTLALSEIAKKAQHRSLLPWIRPIVNHFWHCSSTCNGDVDRMTKRWFNILHHIVGEHQWPGGRCRHGPRSLPEGKQWMLKDSPTFRELRNQLAVMDHNHHIRRPVQETSEGRICSITQFSRKTKNWVAYERKCKKEYSYIPGMLLELPGKDLTDLLKDPAQLKNKVDIAHAILQESISLQEDKS